MSYPDFLIAGTARAGTTSLYYYLKQHPEIFLPKVKEPCFYTFANQKISYRKGKFAFAVTNPEKYSRLYSAAQSGQIKGDLSTPYLYLHERTISNIKRYHPSPDQLKIVIILRNPADRAFSQYMWKRRDGREELEFEEALNEEENRMKLGFSFDYFYRDRGLYYNQVKAYLENFSQVRIFLLDDFKKDTTGMMKELCRFIGVSNEFEFKMEKERNAGYEPRWNLLGRIVTAESKLKFHILNHIPENLKSGIRNQLDKWNSISNQKAQMKIETRQRLTEFYTEDMKKLQKLIGRDLSDWMKA
ncbi:MAG: sulfotransferase [Bacteroidetes bacterium]|nr:MAG: sulfotransferase [Bacteroidota bacterium]REK04902.1 MAG: sulfotransferase [Bacteroidota bacterium]REK36374.1 MAG: sulfotransferase [Bacteroidota bacterium]